MLVVVEPWEAAPNSKIVPAQSTIQVGPPGEPVARISSSAASLIRWVTQRTSLAEAGAEVSGAARGLDLVGKLRVF